MAAPWVGYLRDIEARFNCKSKQICGPLGQMPGGGCRVFINGIPRGKKRVWMMLFPWMRETEIEVCIEGILKTQRGPRESMSGSSQ